MYICNPRAPTVRWETEIRETLEALGPASLVYAAANNKESALNKVRGKDCRHTRLFSDLHECCGTLLYEDTYIIRTCTCHTQRQIKRYWCCLAIPLFWHLKEWKLEFIKLICFKINEFASKFETEFPSSWFFTFFLHINFPNKLNDFSALFKVILSQTWTNHHPNTREI